MKRDLPTGMAALVAVLALVLAACGGEESNEVAEPTGPDDAATAPDDGDNGGDNEGDYSEAAVELGFDDGPDWSFLEDYSDVELNVMIHPSFYEGIGGDEGLFQEFERLSGATVNVITAPAGESYERQMIEWQTESGTFDVVFPIFWDTHPTYTQHLLPLDDYIDSAPAEWEFGNIVPGLQENFVWDGATKALLFRWGVEAYVYRADLFEEAGVDVPTTFDEIDEAARAVHDTTGRFGWVLRGLGHEIVQDWLSLYATTGGTMYEDDGRTCAVATDDGAHVLATVKAWLDDGVISPDTLAIARDDSVALIQTDRAAQGFFFGPRWPLFVGEDAEEVVQENLAWPDEHPGELSRNTPQSVAISKYSENPEASWALLEYILHPRNTPRHVLEWSGSFNRTTDLELPEVQEEFPVAQYWIEAAETSYVEPSHEQGNQMFDIMNEELTAALLGDKDPEQALSDACQRIDRL